MSDLILTSESLKIFKSTSGTYLKKFKVKGASTNKEKEIIFHCRWFGEPFWVDPIFWDSKTRKKMWAICDTFFGKYILVEYTTCTKRGAPIGLAKGLSLSDVEDFSEEELYNYKEQ